MSVLRVLHLPTQVGGNAWNLSRAERSLGVESDVFYFHEDVFFNHKSDLDNDFLKTDNKVKRFAAKWHFYRKAVQYYDIFHFNFGQTLFGSSKIGFIDACDLLYLRNKNKIIAVTFQGNDARQADYCIKNYKITYFNEIDEKDRDKRIKYACKQRKRISKFQKYADLIYATNPDLINMLPVNAKFRPYTKLDIREYDAVYNEYQSNKPLLVVHAPSNRKVKGTKYIVAAIDRLQRDGYDIELRLIEGVSNDEAIKMYKDADLVVDQLLAGWYGGFAVECMAFGKPVMAYIREEDLGVLPEEMKCSIPIINANSKNIYEKLREICLDKRKLYSIALASRRYVEEWHDNKKIAKGIIQNYEEAERRRYKK